MTDDHLAAAERWADAQPVRRRGAPWLNTRAEHRPACIADCAQGRAPCPTPAQCGVSAPAPAEAVSHLAHEADDDDACRSPRAPEGAFVAVIFALAVLFGSLLAARLIWRLA